MHCIQDVPWLDSRPRVCQQCSLADKPLICFAAIDVLYAAPPQLWHMVHCTTLLRLFVLQVNKLSSGDPLATRRELYLRNVSSKDLQAKVDAQEELEADATPPTRHQGDVVSFDRSVIPPCLPSTRPNPPHHAYLSVFVCSRIMLPLP